MSTAFAGVLVITRRHREISMTPATALGMADLVRRAGAVLAPGRALGAGLDMLAALGAGQIGLGMILFTAGARLIPAAQAGLITLLEIVLGPLWVWLIYREQPDELTLAGGSVISPRCWCTRSPTCGRRRSRCARDVSSELRRAGAGASCRPAGRRRSRDRGAPCARSRPARRRRRGPRGIARG